jgi:hypothetical protein
VSIGGERSRHGASGGSETDSGWHPTQNKKRDNLSLSCMRLPGQFSWTDVLPSFHPSAWPIGWAWMDGQHERSGGGCDQKPSHAIFDGYGREIF